MSESPSAGGLVAWVELAELLREGDAMIVSALALLRNVQPALDATVPVEVAEADTRGVLFACETLIQWSDVLANLTGALTPEAVELHRPTLRRQAAAALAAGVADVRRVRVLARCLPVAEGRGALAEALRCTDCHESWLDVTVGDVLGCFEDADDDLVERVTVEAMLSPSALWERCDRVDVIRLANALDRDITRCAGDTR